MQALVVVTYLAMIATNALANALPINGISTGAVSDSYPNLFAPAGITFAIWGVIYLLLGAHVLYQLGLFRGPKGDEAARAAMLRRVGLLFAASSVANVVWLLCWRYGLSGLSALLLIAMLVLLILITRTTMAGSQSLRDKLFVRLPFSVYFGWVTVAVIANSTVFLVSVGWDGFGIAESTWATIIIVVGALIALAVILRDRDVAYGLVLVWAYFGIWLKHSSDSGHGGQYPGIMTTTLICIGVFLVAAGTMLMRRRGRISD